MYSFLMTIDIDNVFYVFASLYVPFIVKYLSFTHFYWVFFFCLFITGYRNCFQKLIIVLFWTCMLYVFVGVCFFLLSCSVPFFNGVFDQKFLILLVMFIIFVYIILCILRNVCLPPSHEDMLLFFPVISL